MRLLLIPLLLTLACATPREPWQSVEAFPVCRHKVRAWVEECHAEGIVAWQVWYTTDEGRGHAVAQVRQADGTLAYIEVVNGRGRQTWLSQREVRMIWSRSL